MHNISPKLPDTVIEKILGFHSLTGCDTSSFTGFGKKSCWMGLDVMVHCNQWRNLSVAYTAFPILMQDQINTDMTYL